MTRCVVSVHVPKTGGSSLRHQLVAAYGADKVLLDYADGPLNPVTPINLDPNCYAFDPIRSIHPHEVVHGHFHPKKYACLDNCFRVTFLRHPVDNLISIWKFWSAHDRGHFPSALFQYFKDRRLSVVQTAALPALRWLYTRTYFGDYDMGAFDFIGDYAAYDADLTALGGKLGVEFRLDVRLNVTAELMGKAEGTVDDAAACDAVQRAALADLLRDDIAFYDRYRGQRR